MRATKNAEGNRQNGESSDQTRQAILQDAEAKRGEDPRDEKEIDVAVQVHGLAEPDRGDGQLEFTGPAECVGDAGEEGVVEPGNVRPRDGDEMKKDIERAGCRYQSTGGRVRHRGAPSPRCVRWRATSSVGTSGGVASS